MKQFRRPHEEIFECAFVRCSVVIVGPSIWGRLSVGTVEGQLVLGRKRSISHGCVEEMLCFHFGVAFIEKGGDVRCWRGLSSVHILVSNVLLQSIELSTCSCVPIDCRWGGEDSALAADALASLWLRRGSTPSPGTSTFCNSFLSHWVHQCINPNELSNVNVHICVSCVVWFRASPFTCISIVGLEAWSDSQSPTILSVGSWVFTQPL